MNNETKGKKRTGDGPRTNLQAIRQSRNLTQKELSEYSGVNYRLLADYETGRKNINGAHAIRVYHLSKTLQCDMPDLLELSDEDKE